MTTALNLGFTDRFGFVDIANVALRAGLKQRARWTLREALGICDRSSPRRLILRYSPKSAISHPREVQLYSHITSGAGCDESAERGADPPRSTGGFAGSGIASGVERVGWFSGFSGLI